MAKRQLFPLQPTSKCFSPKRLAFASQRSLRWPCRCRREACQARASLPKHPDEYTRPRRCPNCRERGTMRVDWFRVSQEWHVKPCACYGYSFPHARGRGFCEHNPAITPEALQERQEYGSWA